MAKFRLSNLKDLSKIVKELMVGLRALTFADNFESFEIDVTIDAGAELSVRNQLLLKPTRVIIEGQTGNGLITKGTWNDSYLIMKNNGAETVTAKLLFLK